MSINGKKVTFYETIKLDELVKNRIFRRRLLPDALFFINPDQAIHILVVDPFDLDFQRLVQLLTDYASIRLCRATTLQAAIPEVMQGDHDVILLEHLLPDGTGVELIQQMNEQGIAIPVKKLILLGSGFRRSDEMHRFRTFYEAVIIA